MAPVVCLPGINISSATLLNNLSITRTSCNNVVHCINDVYSYSDNVIFGDIPSPNNSGAVVPVLLLSLLLLLLLLPSLPPFITSSAVLLLLMLLLLLLVEEKEEECFL